MNDTSLTDSNVTVTTGEMEGVRTARIVSFFIDYAIVLLLCIPFSVVVAFLGLITMGLGWSLYAVLPALVAVIYLALTLGGPKQATLGMQMTGVTMKKLDGTMVDPTLAILHGILFWIVNFSIFLLLVSFLSSKKRLAHDVMLGTYVVRNR